MRNDYLGSWLCQETSQLNGAVVFTVTISASPLNSSNILLENFYNLGKPNKPYAITNGNFFTIPSQQILGNIINGTATLQGTTTISMNYTVFDGGRADTVTAVMTRQ